MEQPAVNPGWRKSSYSANGGTGCVEVGTVPWRKATYSENGGTGCVEVGAIPWRKASHSENGGTACVEAAHVPGAVLVRDTRDRDGFVLAVPPAAWRAFATGLKTR